MFCYQHRFQPYLLLFSLLTFTGLVAGLFQDLIKPYLLDTRNMLTASGDPTPTDTRDTKADPATPNTTREQTVANTEIANLNQKAQTPTSKTHETSTPTERNSGKHPKIAIADEAPEGQFELVIKISSDTPTSDLTLKVNQKYETRASPDSNGDFFVKLPAELQQDGSLSIEIEMEDGRIFHKTLDIEEPRPTVVAVFYETDSPSRPKSPVPESEGEHHQAKGTHITDTQLQNDLNEKEKSSPPTEGQAEAKD